ncbi:carbohydrate-binding protein [Chitinolyticbacter albus]|uniref:carbohydrate-binding protein n=1 Tax=Chitinolyticbacter albus TaxID=2961951 RepID=UPI002108A520|nr:carbohydrate-binding protein [Chitinolyticbacter albus]
MNLKPMVLACALALSLPAHAGVVISQVYGGGGNSGAPYTHDFIEVYNAGSEVAILDGWSVQYASSSGTSWQRTHLTGTLQPGQYYLVQQAVGANTGATPLPTPDAIGTIAMSASAGKVALVKSTTALACGSACSTDANVADFIGFGSASDAETAPITALNNASSALRRAGGCTDSGNNAADFEVAAPQPRNGATITPPCSSSPTPTPTPTPTPGNTRIHDIQGTAHRSPLTGQTVSGVPGIVTLVVTNGFYFQDPQPDADPRTSEGLLVYTGSAPTVAVGDSVLVSGRVAEFRPGGSGGATNLTITELTSPQVSKLASNQPLPAPVQLTNPPTERIWQGQPGDIETAAALDLANGIDYFEALEGMRIQLDNAVATGPTNSYDEVSLLANAGQGAGLRTPRGGIIVRAGDFNPERVIFDAGSITPPKLNVGDGFARAVGVLDYNFGNYKLLATELSPVVNGGVTPEITRPARREELSVASFNVENLSPKDDQAKFQQLAVQIVTHLQAPDLIGLMEVQDNNGPDNDAVVSANETLNRLVAAIAAAGGPAYAWRAIDPVDDQDGGQPGGNIRVAFLYNPNRIEFGDKPGGGTTVAVGVTDCGNRVCLTHSPGRIAPTDAAFANSRKPLVAEFRYAGQTLFVIANHWNSKGGDEPLFGRNQPPLRVSETQRQQQAELVAGFVRELTRHDANAKIIVLGDLNDFPFSNPVNTLKAAGLIDLVELLPENERYTYVFEGNSQALDHILASANLAVRADYDVVHVNAEFHEQTSDHDPEVARFAIGPTVPGCYAAWTASTVYSAGQRASVGSINFEARWWTRGENPSRASQWEAWRSLGVCSTAIAADTPPQLQPSPTITPWQADGRYALGDRVAFAGRIWQCTVAHAAQPAWQPDVSIALWRAQ